MLGEFGQREDDEVRGAEDGEGAGGAGEHADFEAEILGDAGGDGFVHGGRVDSTPPR